MLLYTDMVITPIIGISQLLTKIWDKCNCQIIYQLINKGFQLKCQLPEYEFNVQRPILMGHIMINMFESICVCNSIRSNWFTLSECNIRWYANISWTFPLTQKECQIKITWYPIWQFIIVCATGFHFVSNDSTWQHFLINKSRWQKIIIN